MYYSNSLALEDDMCGINAIFDYSGKITVKAQLISLMNGQMVYRGPDDEGVYANSQVALGMRRLSIIDVAGGKQPLYNEDGSIVLICNGEIYNYIELRHALEARGHHFQSGSDTETILHLYEEKGDACLDDLRGMFAFALWDSKRHRLFAARDRVGVKPLYISHHAGVLWLSSELKAIVGAACISPTLLPESLYQFLYYSYPIDQRHTPIEEVTRMLPGEYLIADESGVNFKRYWEPRFGGDAGLVDRNDDEILQELDTTIRLHLRSDVPVGILLSGGIDSATIAAFAARMGSNYTAICAGYGGKHAVDERPLAHKTAQCLGLQTIDVISDLNSYASDFEELVRVCDEPVGDIAAMPQWSLYRQASKLGYKVLLSGIGGDEVFFGYPPWNEAGDKARSLTPEQYARWIGFDTNPMMIHAGQQLNRLSSGALAESAKRAYFPLFALRDSAPQGPDGMGAMLFGAYLVHNGCLLADKLGMGCSVEVRVPLIDHKLVQSIFDLPLARRFQVGRSKVLLRRLLKGILPNAVLDASKRGFSPPTLYLDRLVNKQADLLFDGVLGQLGWLNLRELRQIVSSQRSLPWLTSYRIRNRLGLGQSNWFLFRLLAFEKWNHLISESTNAFPFCLKKELPSV